MNEVMPSDKAMIKDVAETIENLFDFAKNQFLGVSNRISVNGRRNSAFKTLLHNQSRCHHDQTHVGQVAGP